MIFFFYLGGARCVLPQNVNIFELYLDVDFLKYIWVFDYLVYVRKAKDDNIYYSSVNVIFHL